MEGQQASPRSGSLWTEATPRNVFVEQALATPSGQSPRMTHYFSSTTSSPCSFISAVSSIDRDEDDSWTEAKDVHELVCYRSLSSQRPQSDNRISREQPRMERHLPESGGESYSAFRSGADRRTERAEASQCGDGVGQGPCTANSHTRQQLCREESDHKFDSDFCQQRRGEFHADQEHEQEQGQDQSPAAQHKGKGRAKSPIECYRGAGHVHSCPVHGHVQNLRCLPKSDDIHEQSLCRLNNHDNPFPPRRSIHLPAEHEHEEHEHQGHRHEKQRAMTALEAPISPIPLPIVTRPLSLQESALGEIGVRYNSSYSPIVLEDPLDFSAVARRRCRAISMTVASLDRAKAAVSSPTSPSSSSPYCSCSCLNTLDCATALASSAVIAADHGRSSYNDTSPVQESGPDLSPVSSASSKNSHNKHAIVASLSSSELREAREAPAPPLAPSPPSSSLSTLSSLILGSSAPPPPPSLSFSFSSPSSSVSPVVAVTKPSLSLPPGFEAMQDHQFFHHLALQQHCPTAGTASSFSATQILLDSTDPFNNMVASSAYSPPSSTPPSRYHSSSSSIAWTSPQRPPKSPLRLAYQVTTSFSDLNGRRKGKGGIRAHHQSNSSITNRLLMPKLSFDALPREVRIHVFRYLSTFQLVRVSRVSRAWRGVAMDGSLWKVIDTTRYYKTIQDDQLRTLGTAASGFLRYANFRGCVQLSANSLRAISEHCPNVEYLNLTGCRSVSSKSIADVCMNMSSLVHLDLAGLQSVNNYTLQAMAVYCRSLQVLNLAWCKQISGAGLSKLTRSCQELRKLNISGCAGLEDRWMPVMGMNLPKLREICLNGCGSLTDRGLIGLLSGLSVASSKKHKRWRMKRRMASSVRVSSLGHLLISQSSCNDDEDDDEETDDEETDDSDVDDRENDEDEKEDDEIENDDDPENDGVQATLAPSTTATLSNMSPSNSSEGLQTKLVYLGLSNCHLLTTESLRAIGHHCGRNLRRLELSGCENFGDEGLLVVAQHCRHLRLLDLEDVTLLTDVSLRAFGLNLQKLERICLSYCENVSDQGILRMIRPAPNPTTLSTMNQAMLFSNPEAAKLCCGRLVHMELDNCSLITDRILLEFANVIEERKTAAIERLRERERKREERRERIRQKARKVYSSQTYEQAEPTTYADELLHYQQASCSSLSALTTAAASSSSSSFISSAPVNIPDRFRHQRPMMAIHASVASLAGPPSISSYSSSPLQPRSVLASTFMSGEIVLKKTRPGMRIMGPCRSNSLTLPAGSIGASSSSASLPYWPTTSSNLQSTFLSRSATMPAYSSRSRINIPASVTAAHSLAAMKMRRRRLIRPTLQVFDCRNVTLEGVESAQARCSTLAIKSCYSWSHPSTATAVAATAVSPLSHAAAGFSSSLIGFGNSGDASGLDGHGHAGLLEYYDDEDEELDEDGNSSHHSGSSGGYGGGSSSSVNVVNESQSSLHHLQLQHQHLQQQQQQLQSRRSRAARLLHRARMGLLGQAGGEDSPCSIL